MPSFASVVLSRPDTPSYRRAEARVRRFWGEAEFTNPIEFALDVNLAWIISSWQPPPFFRPTDRLSKPRTASEIIAELVREHGL